MRRPLLALSIAFAANVSAQITIGEDDMPNANDTLRYRTTIATGVDVGTTGAGIIWDFGQLNPLLEAADTACFGLSPAPLTVPGAYVIRAAIQAALVISNGECLDQVESWLYAESVAKTNRFGKGNDPFTLIRLGVVEALENCPRSETEALLEDALEDPHPQVREQARAVLRRRKGIAA